MYPLTKFGIVVTAAALSCWPAAVLAGPTVPYKDSAAGTATAVVPTSPTTVDVEIAGMGVATHMGLFQGVGSHTLDLQTGEVLDGEFTYTAADGSTISGTYSGTFKSLGTAVELDLTLLFLEGTGRLEGVTGTAETVVISEGAVPGSRFTLESLGTWTKP